MFRKLLIIFCVSAVLMIVTGTQMALFSQDESIEEKSNAAVISDIQGEVEVLPDGETEWGKAEQGQALNPGDKVRTMDDSAVEMEYDSGALSSLESNSEMRIKSAISDYDNDKYKTTLNLTLGKILVNVKKLGKEKLIFGVETPVAVAAVRGTEFVVDATSADDTAVATFSGKVRVKKKGMKEFVVVKKNRKIEIKKKTIKLRKPSKIDKKTLKLKKKFVRLKKKAITFRKKKLGLKRKRIKERRKIMKLRKKNKIEPKNSKLKTKGKQKLDLKRK